MILEALVILSAGLIILIVSLPLIYRKVPMNPFYGIRIPAAFESNQRWYDINAYGGRQMAGWSSLIIASGAVGFVIPNDEALVYMVLCGAAVLVAVLIPLLQVLRWSRHLPRLGTASPGISPDISGQISDVPVVSPPGNHFKLRTIIPALVLVLLMTIFVLFINESGPWLPAQVATHFGTGGHPNGWMDRQYYLHFITVLGLTVTLVIAALAFAWDKLRSNLAASPAHGDRPAGKSGNGSWMTGDILWLACLILCFIAGTHYLTVEANRSHPVELPAIPLAILMAGFGAGNIGWIILLCFHRTRKPEAPPATNPGGANKS